LYIHAVETGYGQRTELFNDNFQALKWLDEYHMLTVILIPYISSLY